MRLNASITTIAAAHRFRVASADSNKRADTKKVMAGGLHTQKRISNADINAGRPKARYLQRKV
jgi:hypothetical protein